MRDRRTGICIDSTRGKISLVLGFSFFLEGENLASFGTFLFPRESGASACSVRQYRWRTAIDHWVHWIRSCLAEDCFWVSAVGFGPFFHGTPPTGNKMDPNNEKSTFSHIQMEVKICLMFLIRAALERSDLHSSGWRAVLGENTGANLEWERKVFLRDTLSQTQVWLKDVMHKSQLGLCT